MAYDPTLKEEEIKNRVAADVFGDYDCARILGAVGFCVTPKTEGPQLLEPESLLWAEAKAGVRDDFAPLFAQLILTLGKARTFDEHLPPPFLGAFDCEKIAFVPYHEVVDIFYQNDFNWNVAPSDPSTREFGLILDRIRPLLASNLRVFRFAEDAIELDTFVGKALRQSADGKSASLSVTRNNFVFVYQKWARDVKPSIAVNWDGAKKQASSTPTSSSPTSFPRTARHSMRRLNVMQHFCRFLLTTLFLLAFISPSAFVSPPTG